MIYFLSVRFGFDNVSISNRDDGDGDSNGWEEGRGGSARCS